MKGRMKSLLHWQIPLFKALGVLFNMEHIPGFHSRLNRFLTYRAFLDTPAPFPYSPPNQSER